MKKLIIIILMAIAIYSQEFRLLGNQANSKKVITDTLKIEGKAFIVNIGHSGNHYLVRESKKSGKQYRQYLGYTTGHKFQGKRVFSNKEQTKYWILAIGRTGFPKKLKLVKE